MLVERLVAEEYVLDTCNYFEPDRVECAKRLAGGASRAARGQGPGVPRQLASGPWLP